MMLTDSPDSAVLVEFAQQLCACQRGSLSQRKMSEQCLRGRLSHPEWDK